MLFGRPPSFNVGFQPSPPDRGSFPLDHDGACKKQMLVYMECLRKNSSTSSSCRGLSRDYLGCRMKEGLMEPDDWKNLGMDKVGTKRDCGTEATGGGSSRQ